MKDTLSITFKESVIATYQNHLALEDAVNRLTTKGFPLTVVKATDGTEATTLIPDLVALGIPRNQVLEYEKRLQAGEIAVVVHGTGEDTAQAHALLQSTAPTVLQKHLASCFTWADKEPS